MIMTHPPSRQDQRAALPMPILSARNKMILTADRLPLEQSSAVDTADTDRGPIEVYGYMVRGSKGTICPPLQSWGGQWIIVQILREGCEGWWRLGVPTDTKTDVELRVMKVLPWQKARS